MVDLRKNTIDKSGEGGEGRQVLPTGEALFNGAIFFKISQRWVGIMKREKFTLLLVLTILSMFLTVHFFPVVLTNPDTVGYSPSGYNLLGSTTYVSGNLADLQSDNGAYMSFRSYVSSSATSNKAMFAYGEGTSTMPRYRTWSGTSWSTEASASTTVSTVQWVVLKPNPKRDEKILGTLASTGAIHVQVWNGISWSTAQVLGTGVGTTNDAYRGFDIAFEQNSGRAIAVFVPWSTAVDPQYVIWDGSSWTAPATIDIPTTGRIYWVKLASRPLSNQIALMTLDANSDIVGMIWDGSAWGNSRTLTTTASTSSTECFAVEYEQQSGYAMFVWGEVATDLYYWRWNGSAWIGTTKALLDIPSQGGVSNWISLKADPNSNMLMLGVQDSGSDLNTRQWNGASWDTATEHPEHDSTVENTASRSFDIEYETFLGHSGHAILVWGDGYFASWKHWTPTTGSSGWSSSGSLSGSDDTAVTQLRRNNDGTIFAVLLDDPASSTDDLVEYRWSGSSWSSRFIIEGTPSMTTQPMMEPFMIAPDAHLTPAEYTLEVEFTGSSNTYYWTQLVWTVDSAWTIDSVAVTLQLYNYTLGGYPTSGNGYISYTSSATPNTDESKSQTITVNPMHFRDSSGNWKLKIKGVKSTSTQFDFKGDLVSFVVTYVDVNPPVWSNAGTNNNVAGQATLFYVKWTDDSGLSGFIFGTNNTGTWTNDTWVPISGTTNWSNVTKILNNTAHLVHWRVWANDTSNNWNNTGILSLTLHRLPVASFTYSPLTPQTGETVTFNASASYDPDGSIVSYFWTFGDGGNGTGMITTHAYADNGVYTITLTVTDNDGLTDTDTQSITVLNRPPVASFTESATSVPTGTTIYFNASASYDLDGSIVSYFWDFGDGTNGVGVTIEHAYADNGTYTVTLTVTDDDGATAIATAIKTISNRPPTASFTENATTVYTGEVIHFDASGSYDSDGYITSYFWDFGDGTNATGVTVDHSYAGDGIYTVTLTIKDDDGATASATATKTVLNRAPVASFTESATIVFTGEVITFNASGSYDLDGSIVSYFWDFSDGKNATGLIVTHAYSDNGDYVVTLIVMDDDGSTGSSNATKTVLNRPPIASFTESGETVYTGETITFNASASYDPDGIVVSYFWDFGDGTNATGVTVGHAFADDGVYAVTLTVTDDDGATAIQTATKTILNRAPIASFTESATAVYTGEVIYFNASASYDSDGVIVSYFWDFGDGTNGTGVTVDHAYVDDGSYVVTLTVTDDDGAIATAAATKIVSNRPPIASFTESATTVYTGEIIYFNASASYDPDGSIVSYFWTFGDGANATGVNVSHAYADNGTYNVTLTVTDNDGATTSTSAIKTVLNRVPVASFTESATTVLTNEIIYFNASGSYDPDGTIVSYFWTFGDGTNATGSVVSHAYSDNGIYLVTLIVTDNDGGIANTTATKTVLNRPPVAIFTESAETVYIGQSITFNASSSYDPDGTIVSYFWDFGDGTNATDMIVSHVYTVNGTFTVTLTVTDNDGASNSTSADKTILWNERPVALFTESAETVYTSESITFNASASYDPDGTIVSYFWNFGDGTNATGVVVTHAYADDGLYAVTLIATDNLGATGSTSAIKTVLNRSPVASFTETAETVFTGEIIYFNASASYDPDGTMISYFWDFGDGTNATGVTVSHAYTDNGVYIVILRVTDDDGASSSTTAVKTVLNRPPVATFTESATTVYTGEVIYFNASASYDSDGVIVSYFWDFGDGTNATGVTVSHAYADNAVYIVTLTVTDDDGATATETASKTVLNRSPVALFTESATTAYTGEVIIFNASTSYDPDGTIVSYFWDFGDGTNATGITTSHAYVDNGVYTVTLTVTDNDGAAAIQTATKTILNRAPIASFTESATTVYTDEVIYFNASTSYDQDGYIASYFWDFGDGTNATGVTVSHAYVDNGIYTVTLTVTDNDGATGTATATKTALNRPPVASFTESAETIYTGQSIFFNASSSYDPDGTILSYEWDFGDGNITTVTTPIITHAYVDNGTYIVTLTVFDNDGATASASSTKTVLNRSPVAVFTYSPSVPNTGQAVTFNATASYDPDGSVVSYRWDFGDGNVTTVTSPIVTHVYADNGTYTVILTITDNDGATDTASASIIVLNRPPVAAFTESATTVFTGEVISFNASASYDPDGSIVSYFWDFGDGSNATGVTVNHAYAENGVYTVTLTVTDNDGAKGTATATKTVLNQPPVSSFTENATTVLTGVPIRFNASDSYDPDGTVVSYFWDFGDGTNATGMVVDHAYLDDGIYTVTLTVTDNDGATATSNATKTILNRPPVASFTETAETVYTGESVTFNASASYDPDGAIVTYWWDFGDGTNATGIVVNHAYADDGVYTVTLTVTDDDGANASESAIKTVLNRSPIAAFTESAETVVVGQVIYFNASQSYDPDGTVVSYFWDFGDGTNATGVTVEHAYADNGVYIVTLTITDDDGATASANAMKNVEITPPVAIFTESAETVYTGEIVTFNASASYDPDGTIVSYFWTFGDGTNATGMIVAHAYADNGTYTVTLTVTDDDGAIGMATAAKTVLNRAPVASFTESATTVYTSEVIYFNASGSYDSDGSIVSYFWDFGDGSNATGIVVQHQYVENGVYTVTLTITDDDGAVSAATATKTVLNRPPIASFSYVPTFPMWGEMVTFNASASYDPDGTITNYAWDFGDGNVTVTTSPIITHTYTSYGDYTVALTVEDNDGGTATTTKIISAKDYPIADFTYTPTTPYNRQTVTFNASISDPRGGFIVSYVWDFGDGFQSNTTDPVITHVYTAVGNYTVTLTVTDSEGLSGTTSKPITVVDVPPVANFIYTPSFPAVNQTIVFDASSSYDPNGHVVSYVWNFGDGNVTSTTDPIIYHKYGNTGNYTVRLTVTDNGGLTGTTSKLVTINPPPQANFDYTPEYPYVGDVVTFNASSSTAGSNKTIVSYVWDFGDGSAPINETDPITTHVYKKAGNFTARLTITDSDGLTNTVSNFITIVKAPVASFTYSPISPKTSDTITFNASESYDPNGHIVSYVWDFGDGNLTTVTTPVITHRYVVAGNYTVVLIISDNEGYTDTLSKVVTVLPSPPIADFIYTPDFPIAREIIVFNASNSSDIDGTVVSYMWDFGDGNTTTTTNPIITHKYAMYGNYTVILTITDSQGLSDNKTLNVRVRDYPTADFTVSPAMPNVNSITTFNASLSVANGGVIVSYFWDFGDGSQLNTATAVVTHIYVVTGNYTVTLTITDSEGLNDTTSKMVQVVRKPTASFTFSPSNPYVGDTVTFNASSSYDIDGYIVYYIWNFGDGSPIVNSTNPIATHIYSVGGNHSVTLTVTDNVGLSGTTSHVISVNKAPGAVFTYSPNNPIANNIVTFNASQSYDVRRSIVNYTWDFGDGNVTTTTSQLITHTYTGEGSYIVRLTVMDTGGYSDTCVKTITIRNYPIADFVTSPSYPIKGQIATFDASSSQPRGGTINTYVWNFGDGTELTTTYPTVAHTFTAVGEYAVTLTVIDSEGLTGTIIKTIKVRDYPTAVFSWSPISPVATEIITFDASLSKANSGTITTYIWDFGDGSPILTTSSPIFQHSYGHAEDYRVTLTVLNSEGLSSSITKTVTVSEAPPTALFTYAPTVVITNQTVTFDASASYDPDGFIVSYTWNFGDGNVTTTNNPLITHAYEALGNYSVTLTVTDNDGLSASLMKTVKVATYPTVEFDWAPLTPQSTKPVVFNASLSKANSGVIVSYTWNFGDGNTTVTTNPVITHVYVFYGNYSVALTVLNSEGLSAKKTQILTVVGCPPEAGFTWSPTTPAANETITFDASSSIPNGGIIVFYEWDFGDGTSSGVMFTKTVTHEYTTSGNYVVTLKVTDSEKIIDTVSKIIAVGDYPYADFAWSPEFPEAYEPVTFNASTSNPNGGTIVSYVWNFGDGNTTTSSNWIITHYYNIAGDYVVTLNVTDSEGFWSATSKTITVLPSQHPQADFTWSPDSPYVNEATFFNASTSTPNGGVIVSYTWNFGDGNVTTTSNVIISHNYALAGNYTVTLEVTDSQGLSSGKSKPINISPQCGPTANFTWNPSLPKPNQTITFDASNSIPGWNGIEHPPIVSYVWAFGDGNVTTTTDPIIHHTYALEGNYTVTLVVVDSDGSMDSSMQMVSVSAKLIGDVNGDGVVNMVDIYQLILHFMCKQGEPGYVAECDLNNDGIINMQDIYIAILHFMEQS